MAAFKGRIDEAREVLKRVLGERGLTAKTSMCRLSYDRCRFTRTSCSTARPTMSFKSSV